MTRTAWRAVHPDLRSSRGFRWPWPGGEAVAPLPAGAEFTRGGPCPEFPGDGLCLAKTWRGAASGGIPAITCLLVEFDPADVLGGDDDKLRVSRCRVVDVFDASGVVTVNPPPDPAEQIAADVRVNYGIGGTTHIFRRLIDEGWIVPGPACDGVDPDPRDAVVEAAEAWVREYEAGRAACDERLRLRSTVRAWREARS